MEASSTQRLTRLLALVPWLRTHDGVSIADAAAHFGVETKVLVDDLDLLVCTGPGQYHGELLDIWYDEDGIRVLDPQTLDRPMRFTGQEAAALAVGLRVLADSMDPSSQEVLDRLRAKIEAAATEALPAGSVAWSAQERNDDAIVGQLREAIAADHAVSFAYRAANADAVSDRIVDPFEVMWMDGRAYLVGWCRSAGARRTFRVDRMVDLAPTDEMRQTHAGAADRTPDVLTPSGTEATIELAPEASTAFEAYPVRSTTYLSDGRSNVVVAVGDPRWITRVLLRLGDGVLHVSPPDISELVAAQAQAALDAYDAQS